MSEPPNNALLPIAIPPSVVIVPPVVKFVAGTEFEIAKPPFMRIKAPDVAVDGDVSKISIFEK